MIFSISLLHLLSIPAPAHMFVLLFRPISLILVVQATAMAEYQRKGDFIMERKTDKELAVEATIEYIKSWNVAEHTSAATTEDFTNALKKIYSTIHALDNM